MGKPSLIHVTSSVWLIDGYRSLNHFVLNLSGVTGAEFDTEEFTLWLFPVLPLKYLNPEAFKVARPALTEVGLIQVLGQPVADFMPQSLVQWDVCRDLGACQQYERMWPLSRDLLWGCCQINKAWDSPKPKSAG